MTDKSPQCLLVRPDELARSIPVEDFGDAAFRPYQELARAVLQLALEDAENGSASARRWLQEGGHGYTFWKSIAGLPPGYDPPDTWSTPVREKKTNNHSAPRQVVSHIRHEILRRLADGESIGTVARALKLACGTVSHIRMQVLGDEGRGKRKLTQSMIRRLQNAIEGCSC